jgi:phosphonate C-P lyase system protein PhnH
MNMVTLDPVWWPENHQRMYGTILDAFSNPGSVFDLSDAIGDSRAVVGVLACLVDASATYADPDNRLTYRETRMLGTDCVPAEEANFVVHNAAVAPPPGYAPRLGDSHQPETAATLILIGRNVGNGPLSLVLESPGVEAQTRLRVGGFDSAWFDRRACWVSNFPRGVDILLCDATHVAALPRMCRITAE